MTKLLPILLISLISFQFASAQKNILKKSDGSRIAVKEIDNLVNDLMIKAEVTGLAVGIINNNKVDYVNAFGFKNKSLNQSNDTATCFYAASFSKSLFAYLVMQLVDEKRINLDKPLYEYLPKPLPEYDNYKDLSADDRWKLITARHCLSHTTGFPNWRQLNPKDNNKLEIFFKPGTRYAYSGEGLLLLQLVIEHIVGRKLEELAEEKIFKPLGMYRTSYIWQERFENNFAAGHDYDEDPFQKRKRKSSNAAGSMETTISDYTRFMANVLQKKGISDAAWKDMLAPQIGIFTKQQFPSLNNDTTSKNKMIQLSYGLGWGLFKSKQGWAFFKEGHSDDGWQHYTIAIPNKKYALVLMSNSLNGESIYKELVEKLSGISIPWEWEGYTPYRPIVNIPEQTLSLFTGTYDGKLKAIVTLENGRLKVASPTIGLAKTALFASSENRFFMKTLPVEIVFQKDLKGNIEKMIVIEEKEEYELKKIDPKVP